MEKLDRLGWAAGVAIESYGARVGVRVDHAASLDAVVDRLPPGWEPARTPVVDRLYSYFTGRKRSGSRDRHRYQIVYADLARQARTRDTDEALAALESSVQLFVAETATDRVFVHAGVVGWRGRAIVIPGPSYSGKSALVAALVRAGASYYSDEYAVVDPSGRVHPFARLLSLRDNGDRPGSRYSPRDLGGSAATESSPVGLVVATKHAAGAEWQPRRLSPGNALLELLANSVAARSSTRRVLSTLRHVALGAEALTSRRGEANETARHILSYADSMPPA